MIASPERGAGDLFIMNMIEQPNAVHRAEGAIIAEAVRHERRRLVASGRPRAVAALLGTLALEQIVAVTLPRGTWELLDSQVRAELDLPNTEDWDWMETQAAPTVTLMSKVREIDIVREGQELDRVRSAAIPTSFLDVHTPGSRWFGWFDASQTLRAVGGVTGGANRMWPRGAHFGSIGTQPEWQGQGIGAALTAGMIAHVFAEGAASASLGVYAQNQRAIELYRRLGFTTTLQLHSRNRSE